MNSTYYRQRAQGHQQEIAKLQRQKGQEAARVADFNKRSNESGTKASRASSLSSMNSSLREAQRYSEQAAAAQKKLASIEEKIASEYQRLNEAEKNAAREEKREADNRRREEDRREFDHERRMRSISSTLTQHETLHRHTLSAIEKLAQLPQQIKVVFLAANPLDQAPLRLDEEVRAIAEMIRKSEHRGAVKLESCWAVRPLDVLQALNEHRPRVVHISGHGSDQDEIVFQDNDGQTKLVTKEAIVQTMAAASSEIRLVFFNTCYSRNQAEAVVKHVHAAIGMTTSIGDNAARVFAAQFYSAIGFGLSVKRAFEQAKAALMLEGIKEEETPELFVADGVDADQLILVRPQEV